MSLDNILRSSIFRNLIIHKELCFFNSTSSYTFNINFLRNIFIKLLSPSEKEGYIKSFNDNIANEYTNDTEYINSVSRSFIYDYISLKPNKDDIIEFFNKHNNNLLLMELYTYKEILQSYVFYECKLDVYSERILDYDIILNLIETYEDIIHYIHIKEDLALLKKYGFIRYRRYITNKENFNPIYKCKEV